MALRRLDDGNVHLAVDEATGLLHAVSQAVTGGLLTDVVVVSTDSNSAAILAAVQNVLTTVAHTAPTIVATAGGSTALAANANRKYACFVNNSAADVTLTGTATPVAGTGIVLKANGGSYEITQANLYRGVVYAISASGTVVLSVTEGV